MGRTVLLAEDEPMLADMVQWELQEHQATVRRAVNGEETLRALLEELPDLLLLDLLMPVMDGFAVLESMRMREIKVPTVVLSNLSEMEEREKCLRLGARDFIVKSTLDVGDIWLLAQKYLH
jgi:DNA-binding response OmpR family regulator